MAERMTWEVEARWERNGFPCVVSIHPMGHRNGYVGVREVHPAYGKDYNDELLQDINVHGGLTYAKGEKDYPISTDGKTWWFGFDCAHAGDRPDPKLTKPEFGHHSKLFNYPDSTIKTFKYVEAVCNSLADQLMKLEEEK